MSHQEEDSSGSMVCLLAGLGVGIALGGLTALLLAPQSGAQTRARIRETADDTLHRMKDSMDELKAKVDEMAAATREAVAARSGKSASAPVDPDETIATNA